MEGFDKLWRGTSAKRAWPFVAVLEYNGTEPNTLQQLDLKIAQEHEITRVLIKQQQPSLCGACWSFYEQGLGRPCGVCRAS